MSKLSYKGQMYLLPYFFLSGTGGQVSAPKCVLAYITCLPSFVKAPQVDLPLPVLTSLGSNFSPSFTGTFPINIWSQGIPSLLLVF